MMLLKIMLLIPGLLVSFKAPKLDIPFDDFHHTNGPGISCDYRHYRYPEAVIEKMVLRDNW